MEDIKLSSEVPEILQCIELEFIYRISRLDNFPCIAANRDEWALLGLKSRAIWLDVHERRFPFIDTVVDVH